MMRSQRALANICKHLFINLVTLPSTFHVLPFLFSSYSPIRSGGHYYPLNETAEMFKNQVAWLKDLGSGGSRRAHSRHTGYRVYLLKTLKPSSTFTKSIQ